MCAKRLSTAKGPSQRQLRVGELIRRTLSQVLQRGEIHDPVLTATPITVGEVAVSADLMVATVYVMPLMGGAPVADIIAALARNKGALRTRVAADLTLRNAPDLRFRADETFDRLDETRRLFADPVVQRDLKAPEDPPEEPSGESAGESGA